MTKINTACHGAFRYKYYHTFSRIIIHVCSRGSDCAYVLMIKRKRECANGSRDRETEKYENQIFMS